MGFTYHSVLRSRGRSPLERQNNPKQLEARAFAVLVVTIHSCGAEEVDLRQSRLWPTSADTAMTCHFGSRNLEGKLTTTPQSNGIIEAKMSEYNIVVFAGEYWSCPKDA